MRRVHPWARAQRFGLALLALSAFGCKEGTPVELEAGFCRGDSDCALQEQCVFDDPKITIGRCGCRSDDACESGEFCNTQKICQGAPGCRSNIDCANTRSGATLCDVSSGKCIEKEQQVQALRLPGCGIDASCPLGQVCLEARARCVEGCYEDGDCPLYQYCNLTGVGAGNVGECRDECKDNSFCPYAHFCRNGRCEPADIPRLCDACQSQTDVTCGGRDSGSVCVINEYHQAGRPETGSPEFCVPFCEDEGDCPSGMSCVRLSVVEPTECTVENNTCEGGRACVVDEGAARGFCACGSDEDCTPIPNNAAPGGTQSCQGSCGGFGLAACEDDSDCRILECVRTCAGDASIACTTDDECPEAPNTLCQANNKCSFPIGRDCQSDQDCLIESLCLLGACQNLPWRSCSTGRDCLIRCNEQGRCDVDSVCGNDEGLGCDDLVGTP